MTLGRVGWRSMGIAAALALSVATTACSDAGSPEPTEQGEDLTAPSAEVVPSEGPTGQAEPSTDPGDSSGEAGGTGAPGAASASFPPETRDDLLDALWEIAGLEGERPEVDLIREVDDDEWLAVHVECMTDMGFPTTLDGSEAVRWDIPAGQTDAFALAEYTCSAQYPRLMIYQQPYSTDQLTLMYDWMIEETIPCLAAEGYQVTDVVSLETFIAGYSPQGGFWTPDVGVTGGVPIAVQGMCSHMPPQEVLYGQ